MDATTTKRHHFAGDPEQHDDHRVPAQRLGRSPTPLATPRSPPRTCGAAPGDRARRVPRPRRHSKEGHGFKGWLSVNRAPASLALRDAKFLQILKGAAFAAGESLLADLANLTRYLTRDLNENGKARDARQGVGLIPLAVELEGQTQRPARVHAAHGRGGQAARGVATGALASRSCSTTRLARTASSARSASSSSKARASTAPTRRRAAPARAASAPCSSTRPSARAGAARSSSRAAPSTRRSSSSSPASAPRRS